MIGLHRWGVYSAPGPWWNSLSIPTAIPRSQTRRELQRSAAGATIAHALKLEMAERHESDLDVLDRSGRPLGRTEGHPAVGQFARRGDVFTFNIAQGPVRLTYREGAKLPFEVACTLKWGPDWAAFCQVAASGTNAPRYASAVKE